MKNKVIFNPLADSSNIELLDELCIWIANNLNNEIGLAELVAQSKLSNRDLQYLFEKYKQTTPMTYIRKLRGANKKPIVLDKMRITPIFISKDDDCN